jgi:hypothetical protein
MFNGRILTESCNLQERGWQSLCKGSPVRFWQLCTHKGIHPLSFQPLWRGEAYKAWFRIKWVQSISPQKKPKTTEGLLPSQWLAAYTVGGETPNLPSCAVSFPGKERKRGISGRTDP